ncbi:MAG: beta-N-acetylhexosaminidase [Thermoleophilaceae bacterium]|jgi:beta-N-acetylhexosaminidase|nr:beta-N-acetylhexosaminidase [Thermoleophilaceae bacterium]
MRLATDPAARRRLAFLVAAGLAALVAGIAAGAGDDEQPDPVRAQQQPQRELLEAVDRLSLSQQVGQLTISSFPGTAAPAYVRRRLRAGETAGVILFGPNGGPPQQWRRLTGSLQRASRQGALVMVDQEGGEIRTVDWAGPVAGQPSQGGPDSVRRAWESTARQLRAAGINVNLAPVADVPEGAAPVMGSRSFAGDAEGVAARTRAAVEGMSSAKLASTAKHFPGLGRASVNTDDGSAVVGGGLARDLIPFGAAVDAGVPLVMLSHALYPTIDRRRIASQSPMVIGLLREELGFEGVVVTDSIEAQAVLDRSGIAAAAERSLRAGADLILMTGSASWNEVHPRLVARARRSPAFRERVRRSAARVLELKRFLGLRLPGSRVP